MGADKREWFRTLDERLWLKPDEVGAEEAAFIRKALRLRKGQSVLDAPCGAGRIAVHLALAGCSVTGVDLCGRFVRRARRRFRKEGVCGAFSVMDLRELEFVEEFHGIFNWFGSFGYFSERENADVVARYGRALMLGGRLLIDQPNRERILRHFIRRRETDGATIHSRWDPGTQRIHTTWVIHLGRIENRMSIRPYTPAQLGRLFQGAGLTVEAVYGDWEGNAYTRGSRRLVMVGRRKEAS